MDYQEGLQLHAREKKIVFPDISKLESLMLKETTSAEYPQTWFLIFYSSPTKL